MATKKKFVVTLVLLSLLTAVLITGVVMAWYLLAANNEGNNIDPATMNVKLYQSLDNGNTYTKDVSSAEPLFDLKSWEPGDEATRYLQIKNEGEIEAQYYFAVANLVSTADPENPGVRLEDKIDVYINGRAVGKLGEFNESQEGGIKKSMVSGKVDAKGGAGSDRAFTVKLKFSEAAGTECMNLKITKFDLVLKASQAKDTSFDMIAEA